MSGQPRSRVVRLMLAACKERVEDLRPWGVDKFTDSTFADVVRRGDDAAFGPSEGLHTWCFSRPSLRA
jgi:hypothetical protein